MVMLSNSISQILVIVVVAKGLVTLHDLVLQARIRALSIHLSILNLALKHLLYEKAHSTIMLCLPDDVIIEVAEQKTAAALWTKLESEAANLRLGKVLEAKMVAMAYLIGQPTRSDEVATKNKDKAKAQSALPQTTEVGIQDANCNIPNYRHQ
ncbi:hypothetical protein SASPL_122039 [Salvia splendens]|uniref:Uncharacterized protein n=1 Tax=Salvia splendens TaxID=180675 RepID=A0A8X8XIN2_SALSN|nr:hypothetical protein SASPL_122039 [Salvia splendens]